MKRKAKEKERKEKGLEPNKRKIEVEEHDDDCGLDLSGLGSDIQKLATSCWIDTFDFPGDDEMPMFLYSRVAETERYEIEEIRAYHGQATSLALHFLRGSEADQQDLQWYHPRENLKVATNMQEFAHVLLNTRMTDRDDICELCGGAARVSVICTRRQLLSGGNFDLITGFDLNKPEDQHWAWRYLESRRPVCVIMAPTCTPFGPWAHINYWNAHDSWLRSYLPPSRAPRQVLRRSSLSPVSAKGISFMTGAVSAMNSRTHPRCIVSAPGPQCLLVRTPLGAHLISVWPDRSQSIMCLWLNLQHLCRMSPCSYNQYPSLSVMGRMCMKEPAEIQPTKRDSGLGRLQML